MIPEFKHLIFPPTGFPGFFLRGGSGGFSVGRCNILLKEMMEMSNFFEQLKSGLSKTRENFVFKMTKLFTFWKKIDENFWDELEEIMLSADVGAVTAGGILEHMREQAKKEHITEPIKLLEYMKEYMSSLLQNSSAPIAEASAPPTVILIVGVNGTGKTTSIAKLAHMLKQQGKKVMLAAADTFRAAAIDQLQIWADMLGIDLIKHKEGADPAAVCFDALSAARARGVDYLLIDTAGRLHSKSNLMEELKKITRVITREVPGAPHEIFLVVDATAGQNALIQARTFSQISPVTGIILAKLDGTAKGGVVIGIASELNIPVKYIGLGEKITDLQPFEPENFLDALFNVEEN